MRTVESTGVRTTGQEGKRLRTPRGRGSRSFAGVQGREKKTQRRITSLWQKGVRRCRDPSRSNRPIDLFCAPYCVATVEAKPVTILAIICGNGPRGNTSTWRSRRRQQNPFGFKSRGDGQFPFHEKTRKWAANTTPKVKKEEKAKRKISERSCVRCRAGKPSVLCSASNLTVSRDNDTKEEGL